MFAVFVRATKQPRVSFIPDPSNTHNLVGTLQEPQYVRRRARNQRAPTSFRRWIRTTRASYFVAVDVKASIELGVVSLLASLRARCAFSRHDHSMSCRSSTVKWHGTSLGFVDEVGIDPVCQISANPTPLTRDAALAALSAGITRVIRRDGNQAGSSA